MRSDIMPYLRSPNSPVYKVYRAITSPARYINKQIRPGGIKGSIFNLIWGVLGTGMLTLPVVCQENGIVFGACLIALGGLLTIFWGMCIVTCSEKTGSDSLEYIAHIAFGEFVGKLASYSLLFWLIGYVTSYIVIVKTLAPYLLKRFLGENLPSYLMNEYWTQVIVATVYSIFFLLPLSLPRKMGALRFTSLFGFVCCVFLVWVITLIFIFSRVVVPDPVENIKVADYAKFSFSGIFSTFPFIISSYMYQPMIPAIYKNLERPNFRRMEKVVLRGSYGAVFMYILIAVFGYLTFAGDSEQLDVLKRKQNILECNYHQNFYFEIAMVSLIFTIMTAGPLWMIPLKDTWEDMFYGETIMTDVQNVTVTVMLIAIWYLAAIIVPSIGDVITILGLTWNPFIGFFLPVLWFLKLDPDCSIVMKTLSLAILAITIMTSVFGLYDYIASIIY